MKAPLWTTRRMSSVGRLVASHPLEAWMRLQDQIAERRQRRRPRCPYKAQSDWEWRLHQILGVPWPCEATSQFWTLWPEVMQPFEAEGVRIGRGAFGGWGDGEPGMARAIWHLVRHLRPIKVVETGVARGFTTRIILEGLERNGAGHLWSVDLPPALKPELRRQVGAAVLRELRHRWSYIEGSSERQLPKLFSQIGRIDLFIHDSRHTDDNVRFEMGQAWLALRPGGVLVVDDIDLNWGFHSFMQTFSGYQSLICHAEPLEPDFPRLDGKGLFGIIRKEVATEGRAVGDRVQETKAGWTELSRCHARGLRDPEDGCCSRESDDL